MFGLGPMELGIIALVLLLIVGPTMLPKLARSFGQSIKEFRGAGKELKKALDGDDETA